MRQPRTPPADLWSDRTVRAMNGLPFRRPPRPCPAARRDRPSEDPPQMTEPTGPLKGYRILDLTNVLFGPFGTQTLGDWGAEVIKVETLAGDMWRSSGQFRNRGMSGQFMATNRNKDRKSTRLKS